MVSHMECCSWGAGAPCGGCGAVVSVGGEAEVRGTIFGMRRGGAFACCDDEDVVGCVAAFRDWAADLGAVDGATRPGVKEAPI